MAHGVAASATSAGGIGAVKITQINLDPDDGIAPSLQFAPDMSSGSVGTVSAELRSVTPNDESFREFRSQDFGFASSVASGRNTAMASAKGGIAGAGFSAQGTQGQAGSGADSRGSYDVTVQSVWVPLTLCANTAVRFSACSGSIDTPVPDHGYLFRSSR